MNDHASKTREKQANRSMRSEIYSEKKKTTKQLEEEDKEVEEKTMSELTCFIKLRGQAYEYSLRF